ncbi:MAG TPA: ABC transporter ATP-binding protein [Candidatus Atribacteria bacterium]|nr:ABC transporter ATP-binding protein [Candidatus Atribacteria bacterium]
MKEYLQVKDLSFSYSKRKVLDKLTFSVKEGELVGVAGPNGAGKSTLLHLLAGLITPGGGEIIIGGKEARFLSRRMWSKKVAVVFQEVPQNLDLTSQEVVTMGRFPHLGRWQREREVDEEKVFWAMKITSTTVFSDRLFSELSGGEKQRVMIARALAQEPELLLLDEPTSHLDVLHQLEIMDILLDLRAGGVAIVSVFHDLNLVSQFCDKALLLKEGRMLSFGRVEEVMRAEEVEKLFGVEFLETTHPFSLRPFFMPLRKIKNETHRGRIHLICGGGSGSPLMRELLEAGFSLSLGVVNQLDSDEELARKLGIPVVQEKPFSPFSPSTMEEAYRLAQKADFIVIAPTYWGRGNLPNLDLAERLVRENKVVLILKEALDSRFDYTEGEAHKKLERIIEEGGEVIEDLSTYFSSPSS